MGSCGSNIKLKDIVMTERLQAPNTNFSQVIDTKRVNNSDSTEKVPMAGRERLTVELLDSKVRLPTGFQYSRLPVNTGVMHGVINCEFEREKDKHHNQLTVVRLNAFSFRGSTDIVERIDGEAPRRELRQITVTTSLGNKENFTNYRASSVTLQHHRYQAKSARRISIPFPIESEEASSPLKSRRALSHAIDKNPIRRSKNNTVSKTFLLPPKTPRQRILSVDSRSPVSMNRFTSTEEYSAMVDKQKSLKAGGSAAIRTGGQKLTTRPFETTGTGTAGTLEQMIPSPTSNGKRGLGAISPSRPPPKRLTSLGNIFEEEPDIKPSEELKGKPVVGSSWIERHSSSRRVVYKQLSHLV